MIRDNQLLFSKVFSTMLLATFVVFIPVCLEACHFTEENPSQVLIDHPPPCISKTPDNERSDLYIRIVKGQKPPARGTEVRLVDHCPRIFGCGTSKWMRAPKAWTNSDGEVVFKGVFAGSYNIEIRRSTQLDDVTKSIRIPQDAHTTVQMR